MARNKGFLVYSNVFVIIVVKESLFLTFWERYKIPPTAYFPKASFVLGPAFVTGPTPVKISGVTMNSPATLSSKGMASIYAFTISSSFF